MKPERADVACRAFGGVCALDCAGACKWRYPASGSPLTWPNNRNHEAARRRVDQILRDHGRPDYSRRETQIAELLDELIAERDERRGGG